MPVSVATRRPSAPSSPASRSSIYSSSYSTSSASSTARYSSLTRSAVTALDLPSSRFLSDRLTSSSLSRSVRHGSHGSEDSGVGILSRYSSSRERSLEPRASSLCASLCASDGLSRASREGSKSRLDSSTRYTGASSNTKLGRPPLHSSLSSSPSSTATPTVVEDSPSVGVTSTSAPRASTTASTYSRSRSTGVTGGASPVATMTNSSGKPFHSRFLKPKVAVEDKAAERTERAASDKECAREEDDARNNNSIDNGIVEEDDNGNDSRRPSVALLRQRFDVAANGSLNGTTNSLVNGTANGSANSLANGTANGSANSLANGTTNGTANSLANGTANGTENSLANGTANGTANSLANGTANGTAVSPTATPSQSSAPSNTPSPSPAPNSAPPPADGKGLRGRSEDSGSTPLAGGHEDVDRQQPQRPAESDSYESPRLGRRATSHAANGTRGSGLNGLRNIGNTCFMNSVIQCLSNTRPLLEYLLKNTYLSEINSTNSSMKGALIKAFAKMIEELWTGEGQVINTSAFKGQIQHFAPRFMGYSQQDAQEFLRYLLEGLHEDVNRVEHRPTNTVLPDIDDSLSDNQKADESWRRYLRIDNSTVLDVFVGQLKSTLKCTVCSHSSVTFDPFWDLSLPIPSRSGQLRLQQCLEHFTREEVLDGDEKPTCAKCQTRRKCTKSFSIQKFPKILVLHLKRFSPMERFRGKLNVTVEFPLNGLDLSAYAANRGRGCTYNLYGVANHSGTTYSGHYTAYCRHPYTHEWHEYNDSRVSSISARNVVSSEAYVLFYELSGHTSHL